MHQRPGRCFPGTRTLCRVDHSGGKRQDPRINSGASTSYSNWVDGDTNGQVAHWSEGQFVPYIVTINGLKAGTNHTLTIRYDPVSHGRHAIDYLGSFDTTESTSPATASSGGTLEHADHANPCSQLVAAGAFPWPCTPSAPQGSFAIPRVAFGGAHGENGCASSPGSYRGAQEPGAMKLFGPAGSTITDVSYAQQNTLTGSGGCTTTVQVTFTVSKDVGATQDIVVAWGGHIASQGRMGGGGHGVDPVRVAVQHDARDPRWGLAWGPGPHGADHSRQLQAVGDNHRLRQRLAALRQRAQRVDRARHGDDLQNAGGGQRNPHLLALRQPHMYRHIGHRYGHSDERRRPTLVVVQSVSGLYSYRAVYSGDGNNQGVTSACEPFSVCKGQSWLSTVVFNAGTNEPITGDIRPGSSVYDTATLTHSTGPAPTGTVTYTFYRSGSCTTGTVVATENVKLNPDGTVPDSATQGPLTEDDSPFAFMATYWGDGNYQGGTSSCEPFTVSRANISLDTSVYRAPTDKPVTGPLPLDASVYDTATLTHTTTTVPTGTVTYTFFKSGTCTTGSVVGTQTVKLNGDGSVPNSATHGPLTAGTSPYAFEATYSGDGTYLGGTSSCEPFTVGKGWTELATTVYDVATAQPLTGPLPLNGSVYDTADLTHGTGPVPTGTVTYTFFQTGTCTTGTVVGTQTVKLNADGSVPNSATEGPLAVANSPFAFEATYSGDGNYLGGTSGCEPFSMSQAHTTLTTTVVDTAGGTPVTGALPLNSTVYDTATLTHPTGPVPTGTVTYTFFRSGTCTTGTVVGTQTVKLNADGSVPHSADEGPLSAGDSPYTFMAVYSGDANYVGGTSACEPFSVKQGTSSISTVVFDASTKKPATNPLPFNASVYDTATLTHDTGPTPTGTVTYTFYRSGTCTTGTVVGSQTVKLNADGSVPNSATEGPLTAATSPYAFEATYSGDANYVGGTSACEPFSVKQGTSSITTTVIDEATGKPVSGTLPLGATVHDTATLTHATGPTPTGTVTYTYFRAGDCTTGTVVATQVVKVGGDGSVPNSASAGPLTAATSPYAYEATYTGDGNYVGGTSACEPFSVGKGSSTLATQVHSGSGALGPTNLLPLNSTVHDSATLTHATGPTPTGTVTYTFYRGGLHNRHGRRDPDGEAQRRRFGAQLGHTGPAHRGHKPLRVPGHLLR